MQRVVLAGAVVLLALATVPAGADENVAAASGMAFVGRVPFPDATHVEFLVREVDGVRRTFALAGSRNSENAGLRIIDVTDPEHPALVAFVRCPQHNNDVGISPDGTTVVLTSEGLGCTVQPRRTGFQGQVRDFALVDITDIARPVLYGTPNGTPDLDGIHTVVFHPQERIAYLSDQQTPSRAPKLSILDLRQSSLAAARVRNVPMPPVGSGPHDITFNPQGTRAYVSAITATYILDTTDPLNPTVISVIADPTINIHHEAMLVPNTGGRYLVVVDEQAGAITNPQCPGGGVHVFDLADERVPVKVGVFFAQELETTALRYDPNAELPACTAHEGTFTPDGTRLSLGWYAGGARLFDTSILTQTDIPPGAPVGFGVREVAYLKPATSDVWAAKMHPTVPGYVFAQNTPLGFEVYRIEQP